MFSFSAALRANSLRPDVYAFDISKNLSPNSSGFLPRRGESKPSLIWSSIITKSPGTKSVFIAPLALVKITVSIPRYFIIRIGKTNSCIENPS